jgi:hypothetical protein
MPLKKSIGFDPKNNFPPVILLPEKLSRERTGAKSSAPEKLNGAKIL